MLTHIYIKNFAIVDTLEIDFAQGLSVLTGETGAGKSLWVDAVNLALGQRADSQWIRAGEERAEISVTFDIQQQPHVLKWLQEADLDQDNDCILRRVISRQGSSRCTVNGSPLPLQRVRELAEQLIQIHSQHQQQHLLQSDKQRDILDHFAGNHALCKSIRTLYEQWKITQNEIDALLSNVRNKNQEIDFLRYQLDELAHVDLQPGEWQTLSRQHQQLHNAKTFIEQLNEAITLTIEHEDTSAVQLIQQAMHQLSDIKTDDPQLKEIQELLNTASIHLNEAGTGLQAYRNRINLSEQNVDAIESRLSVVYDLSRKHHCNPEDLVELHTSLQNKLDSLVGIDEKVAALKLHQAQLEEKYTELASRLTNKRKKSAKTLEKKISASMKTMDIHDGALQVAFEILAHTPSPHGNEKITFLVQTNAGQGFQPLQKIASGGEISRISLALHVLTADKEQTPTLVFDEVDVGISGKTAATVGQLLRELGNNTQVLCITHLPQVAANGHHHYKVNKQSDGKQTTTSIQQLTQKQRIDEIARLIGGAKVTKQSLAHASELLDLC
ncbi:MAG: DNA repair protein RecN [Coxiella sp. (in: Bacteria)]|nr:MAG: DNA repair protein RecN [Coxiella sp. (in: g-proteobacteria)]